MAMQMAATKDTAADAVIHVGCTAEPSSHRGVQETSPCRGSFPAPGTSLLDPRQDARCQAQDDGGSNEEQPQHKGLNGSWSRRFPHAHPNIVQHVASVRMGVVHRDSTTGRSSDRGSRTASATATARPTAADPGLSRARSRSAAHRPLDRWRTRPRYRRERVDTLRYSSPRRWSFCGQSALRQAQ